MNSSMKDKYIRVARFYPAVLGLLPTCLLMAMCMWAWFPQYQAIVGNFKWVLCLIGGTASVSMAVGYLVSDVFRETSKWLFQYPLFKINETESPTTKMLLWQNAAITPAFHKVIAVKVRSQFGIKLPSQEEEYKDPVMAKKTIAETVRQIRQSCRGDKILSQYNMEFGFCRNYLGASVWSVLFIIIIALSNFSNNLLSWWIIMGVLALQIVLMVVCYLLLKIRGWTYAEYLFATFTSK